MSNLIELTIVTMDEAAHRLPAEEGRSVMMVARDAGLPINAQCDGNQACGTCHIYVDPAWVERVPMAEQAEDDMLDIVVDRTPQSRLSCQIRLTRDLNGLKVALAPGSEF